MAALRRQLLPPAWSLILFISALNLGQHSLHASKPPLLIWRPTMHFTPYSLNDRHRIRGLNFAYDPDARGTNYLKRLTEGFAGLLEVLVLGRASAGLAIPRVTLGS